VLPDGPAYPSLQATVDARERASRHQALVNRLVACAAEQCSPGDFAELAVEAIAAGVGSDSVFKEVLGRQRCKLRKAVIRTPRNRALRMTYIAARGRGLELRDRYRELLVRLTGAILGLCGTWCAGVFILWRWRYRGDVVKAVAHATLPMFFIGWLIALVVTPNMPWGDEVDSALNDAGSAGCLIVFWHSRGHHRTPGEQARHSPGTTLGNCGRLAREILL